MAKRNPLQVQGLGKVLPKKKHHLPPINPLQVQGLGKVLLKKKHHLPPANPNTHFGLLANIAKCNTSMSDCILT
jgi:hypothetical protein